MPYDVYHVLARDPRLKACREQPINKRRMTAPDEKIPGYFATLFSSPPADFEMQTLNLWEGWGNQEMENENPDEGI
jgi:hypothetical protein